MDIERHGRDFVESGYDGNTDTYLRYKVTIHDIDVDKVSASIFYCLNGFAKRTKVSRKNRRCNPDSFRHAY